MKMRKLISLCGALAIAFSTVASAEIASTKLTLNSKVTPVDNDTFVAYYDEDIPEGKAAYFVDFTVSGIADELSYTKTAGTNAKPKYSGMALDNAEIKLYADNIDVMDQDYSYVVEHSLNATVGEGFTDYGYAINYAGNFIYPAAKDTVGVEDGATPSYITMCFVIDADATVNIEVKDSTFSIIEYADGTITGQKDFSTVNGATSLELPATITLAPAGTEEPEPAADVVVNSGDKYDNGYVWNVTVNKDMEAFGVKFYSGEDTLAKSVKNVDALPKLDGGVGYNFNVGLKTAKTIDQADFTADDATASWKAE